METRLVDRVDERRLLKAAQRGDSSAFSDLYRAHVQAVFRYIYFRVSDRDLAEDLTGDVFVRALKSLPTYTDQGKPFAAWLYRIAHARVVDYYRKTGRQPIISSIGERENIPVKQDMDATITQKQTRQQAATLLRQAIATLTNEQQQVIVLRFVEDKHLEEVAQLMGKNANAIKALQHRALRSLAGKLQRSGFPVEEILAGLSS